MIKKLHILFFLSLGGILLGCHTNKDISKRNKTRFSYPNVLNLKGNIINPNQEGVSSFSDLGTWHSFSLVDEKTSTKKGAFVGPFLMRQQESIWLSPSLVGLTIKDVQADQLLDLSKASLKENTFYPGVLKQSFAIDKLDIVLYLFNINQRSSMITAEITNNGKAKEFQLGFSGSVFNNFSEGLRKTAHGLEIDVVNDEKVNLVFQEKNIHLGDSDYVYLENAKLLPAKGETSISMAMSYTFSTQEEQEFNKKNIAGLKQAKQLLSDNEHRWNGYINTLNQGDTDRILAIEKYDRLAVKSLLTLMHNWRSEAGDIKHQGIVPSYAATYFQGLWAWDSWKHAVAIAPFEGELAKDQIRAMYDYQNQEGMIADCFFRDLQIEGVNWRNTKAPLSGWSIYKVFEATKDKDFLVEMYPKLKKYHEWWYINRDHDNNGLCEYGSTDGTRIAAAWESGMDNAVRFDKATIMENTKGAFSINQESVDLNAYLYQEKLFLSLIADRINKQEDAEKYNQEALKLKKMIQEIMYSEEDGFFYDVTLGNQNVVAIQGPEGWSPLYNEIATKEQAASVMKVMLDDTKFNTPMPFPTLSAANEQFNPEKGYWRGPVWLDQAYFGIMGLYNYGYKNEAKEMAEKLVNSAEGLVNSDKPIRENYHPMTKQGLNAEHFSWSAAHILMMF
ncbi:trehalase family glycosidase [Flammeovirga sp. SubArs3]|uniref:MGH1-like glycoside hydrolase domain-containing protein n=1 Tax=Flammeovirga sp. SubArs3 TaxID=2995316 RepID=UPI00248CA7F5|nr:trehalase family glycosidase [Flammeovirga sp. SubArs3]